MPNATLCQSYADFTTWYMLTPCEQRQCDQCTEFGLEALDERCYGDQVEDHVEEVEMHEWEQIEPVHCRGNILASGTKMRYEIYPVASVPSATRSNVRPTRSGRFRSLNSSNLSAKRLCMREPRHRSPTVTLKERTLRQIHLSRLQLPKLPQPWKRDCRNVQANDRRDKHPRT